MPDSLNSLLDAELLRLTEAHLFRERRVVKPIDSTHVEVAGRRCVNFCSNDYLGLTHHPKVIEAMRGGATAAGAGAAALISGYSPVHQETERAIAAWKRTESAILLPSGYQANVAAIQTLAALAEKSGGARFLIDKLAHASLLDAVRGSGTEWRVFPHNGIGKLRRLLADAPAGQMQVVITESIFSMDGDEADLAALAKLKEEFSFVLLLDEAHAGGVYGAEGSGLAIERNVHERVDVFVATFSKAAGVVGGAICGSEKFCSAVVNFGRAYIFSTSIPPGIAAAIHAALGVMRDEPQRQRRLREIAWEFRQMLVGAGITVATGDSPIVPIVVGEASETLGISRQLLERNFLVGAVRPPSVARGTSRLRITLSCEHSEEEVAGLVGALTAEMRDAPRKRGG